MIHTGDCVEVMAGMDAASVDAIVTDPPYDLLSTGDRNGSPRVDSPNSPAGRRAVGFMGKAWDGTGIAFRPETWAAMLRVAKPGAYLLAFGGTRTYHRMACAIEDAGWVIRDCLVWAYASGFPKSRALLKPAWEPIVMARKPGPLRELAIDACRIPGSSDPAKWGGRQLSESFVFKDIGGDGQQSTQSDLGRWPANLILTDPIFDGDTLGVVGGGSVTSGWTNGDRPTNAVGIADSFGAADVTGPHYGDSGTYSRFFLVPKADRAEREPILPSGLPRVVTMPFQGNLNNAAYEYSDGAHRDAANRPARENVHPTVKPLDLMRHLVRLVTPTGGIVLDPFLGSGTTALAAEMEGFGWLGIEREPEYVAIAEARLNGTQRGLGLEVS